MTRYPIDAASRLLLTACLTLAALTLHAQATPFTFTAIPDQDETRLKERFDRIAVYLSGELDTEVRYIPVKSYAAAVTAFRNNQVQLAWFGGLSGVQARRLVPGSEAIAQGYEDQHFKTYFVAYAGTELEKSAEFPAAMAGKTFTFGSKGSTSGRLMPEFYIRRYLGAAPQEVFSRVGFSGDHSRTIALVQSGAYQLGAVNFKVWEKELAAGIVDPERIRVIWETPTYPDYQWTIRGDVDRQWGENFKQRVQQALLSIQAPQLLQSFPRSRFVGATNDLYAPIADTAAAIGLLD